MGVHICYSDYSAMQGPCPNGFHVPLVTEWQAVYNVWTALGGGSSAGTNFGIALKLPFAGLRNRTSSAVTSQGSRGYYWSSSPSPTSNYYTYGLNFRSSEIDTQTDNSRAHGTSIRCFKDTPVIPTSSWTKLYGTSIESGGIFWSSTDGLISLSSDGNTWITIQDKNLGATTVWNSGDTLSEANCGKYYQRGNNYGFAWTGSVTTSSTQVDASNYGPGNYYSSSTFIIRNSRPYDRSSVQNDNLWGGEDGKVPTMTELKNAYIGEYVEPGIYHNATLGLISLSSDGSNWYTIADKNLGATDIWNYGDSTTQAKLGKLYEWGNCFGFNVDTPSTTSNSQINLSSYGPGEFSSSTYYYKSNTYYCSPINSDLRGDITDTFIARRGPCDEGYHVPTYSELDNMLNACADMGAFTINAAGAKNFQTYLKAGADAYIGSNDGVITQGYTGWWTSSHRVNTSSYRSINFSSNDFNRGSMYDGTGYHIRPFKNEAVQPDTSRTKLY